MKLSDISNPRQVILVSSSATMDIAGKNIEKKDIMAACWHSPLSFEPMMYGVSIEKTRYTLQLIRKSGIFIVNFMPSSQKDNILFCGTTVGEHIDKFEETGLTAVECEKVHGIRIDEALGWLECEVVDEIDAGDHIFLIGKVMYHELKSHEKRLFQVNSDSFSEL